MGRFVLATETDGHCSPSPECDRVQRKGSVTVAGPWCGLVLDIVEADSKSVEVSFVSEA